MGGVDLWESAIHWRARCHQLPRTDRIPPDGGQTGKASRVHCPYVSQWDTPDSSQFCNCCCYCIVVVVVLLLILAYVVVNCCRCTS